MSASKRQTTANPLLPALREALDAKRSNKTGLVTRSWILALLVILDAIKGTRQSLEHDDVYTYDYTLKNSRADAIPRLLNKYDFPSKLGMSDEGITTRGAPGFRFFQQIEGGAILRGVDSATRASFLDEAISILRTELLQVLRQKSIVLPEHVFEHPGRFVPALLGVAKNRSHGRVEQALVGSKLQLRYPKAEVPLNPTFAPDKQTSRDSDFDVGKLRVIVSVAPKAAHFTHAKALADAGKEVCLVVSEQAESAARSKMRSMIEGCIVSVVSVETYVCGNMKEIMEDRGLAANEICRQLAVEYNRRISADRDDSLAVVMP